MALKLWQQENERLRYFVLNGGQERFLAEVTRPGAFIVINGGGNGSGKTAFIVALIGALCWPSIAPVGLRHGFFRDWKYPKRIRIASTPKELESIGSLQTWIAELWPRGRYEAVRSGKSYFSKFVTDTGWLIDTFSYEQDVSEMAGPTLGMLIFNEPMPEPLWREGVARLRKGGLIVGAMTSLADQPWIVDGLLNKANGEDVRVVYTDVEENCKQHGKNGTLDHSQIERILSQYDPDEREARKTGKPLALSGRIFKGFDRNFVVIPSGMEPSSDTKIYQVIDPAIGKPFAVLWAAADAAGRVTVFREWPEFDFHGAKDNGFTISDYVKLFQELEGNRPAEVRILDRHFGNVRRTVGGLTLKQEFEQYGMYLEDSYHVADEQPEVETGILKVKEAIKHGPLSQDGTLSIINQPRLQITANCRNTIAALERWSRNPETGKPKEDFKDFADCLRYLVMAEPKYEIDRPWRVGRPAHYGVS